MWLKISCVLLGQQSCFTKFPYFLCEWDSRDQYWSRKDPEKILLPPLHIKIGLMKQFVKALSENGICFKYFCEKFPHLSEAQFKEGAFVGRIIRRVMFDLQF